VVPRENASDPRGRASKKWIESLDGWVRLKLWFEHLSEPPEKGTRLETLYLLVAKKLHTLDVLKTRLDVTQTYLMFGFYRSQVKEGQTLEEVAEMIGAIEADILSIMNPSLPRVREEREQEKKEALKEIRAAGPVKVTSLVPPTEETRLRSALSRIRERVLGDDARGKARRTGKSRKDVSVRGRKHR